VVVPPHVFLDSSPEPEPDRNPAPDPPDPPAAPVAAACDADSVGAPPAFW